jgi:hypothetical protein
MGQGHNFEKFKNAILALSESKDWLEAKPEWDLHGVYIDGSHRTCECGHQPIHQICVIKNRENQNEAEVGNVCVHNFMQLASRRIFAVLRRIENEISKSLNPKALDLFLRRGVITSSEHEDYHSYWRKRTNMTDMQRHQKIEINKRVLAYVKRESLRMSQRFSEFGIKPRLAA